MAKRKNRGQIQRVATDETDGILGAWIDYTQSPYGTWAATVRFDDAPEEAFPINGPDAHETMHRALDFIAAYGEEADVDIASRHSLNGDTTAWAKYAVAHDFVSCMAGEGTEVGFFTK